MEATPTITSMATRPFTCCPDYASTEESTALDGVNTSRRVLLQMAQGITLTETEHVVSDALLVSSDSAYSKPEATR